MSKVQCMHVCLCAAVLVFVSIYDTTVFFGSLLADTKGICACVSAFVSDV